MTLHEAIEQVIQKAGRPLSTREICDSINSQRLFKRGDGNLVPTSQISARVRQSPQWLKKVGSLVTLANDNKSVSASAPVKRLKKPKPIVNSAPIESSLIAEQLVNSKNYTSAKDIDGKVPDLPGLYMIRINKISALPSVFEKELKHRGHNILYIGIASKSLKKRMLGQELRAKGHGTFFRSIGAVLGFTPPAGSVVTKSNKRNYKFSTSDETKIIKWINENLLVNWVSCDMDYNSIETSLIHEHKPIINIAKNPYSIPELSALRKKCVDVANTLA